MVYRSKYIINEEGRECSRCGEFKLWNEFAKNKCGTNGHQSWCSECFRIHEGRTKKKEYLITDKGRECSQCGQFKEWKYFSKRRDLSTGYMSACKKCNKKKYRGEKYQGKVRNRELKRKYGIDLKEYYALLEEQGGGCAICGATKNSIRRTTGLVLYLSVDHNHETGEVRGLLCQSCNAMLGMIGEDIQLLEKAIAYLKANGGCHNTESDKLNQVKA